MSSTAFGEIPTQPVSEQCRDSHVILKATYQAADSFHTSFASIRDARTARGTPTDNEQDLLRACLVFAASGLDAVAKQLIGDALPSVIGTSPGAEQQFKTHVERQLKSDSDQLPSIVAAAISHANPRGHLIEGLQAHLTAGSLQSVEELMRVGAFFDIPSVDLVPNVEELKKAFTARNQIVHELDIDLSRSNRNRRSRTKQDLEGHALVVLETATRLLAQVDLKLSS